MVFRKLPSLRSHFWRRKHVYWWFRQYIWAAARPFVQTAKVHSGEDYMGILYCVMHCNCLREWPAVGIGVAGTRWRAPLCGSEENTRCSRSNIRSLSAKEVDDDGKMGAADLWRQNRWRCALGPGGLESAKLRCHYHHPTSADNCRAKLLRWISEPCDEMRGDARLVAHKYGIATDTAEHTLAVCPAWGQRTRAKG